MSRIVEEDVKQIVKSLANFKKEIEGKTFLVTGGAGFIGSWFCDVLNEFGAKIICVDNLISGSNDNIRHLLKNKNFKLINEDVSKFDTEEKIDYIVHMASIASPPFYQKHPIETLDANVVGTKNILELARKKKVKAILFTSTSEVYGSPTDENVPTPETYFGFVNSFGQRCMYDEGKRAAEAYCYSYFKQFNLPIRIARLFNTYGPKLDVKDTSIYGRALVKFISQALNNYDVTVYGDGKQTRSFCYITDQIIGLLKILLTPCIDGEIFNVGRDEEVAIIDLAKKIIKLTNSKSKLTFHPLPDDDPRRRRPDLNKSNEILNYQSTIALDEGLERTIQWMKQISG